jgi:HEAT repeat protein
MRQRRGRVVAIAAVLLGLTVLGAAGFSFRQRILEEWYFVQLRSRDSGKRYFAATHLGEMRSVRAVPRLIDTYLSDPDAPDYCVQVVSKIGRGAVAVLIPYLNVENRQVRHFAAGALRGIGPEAVAAVPALMKALEHEWFGDRIYAAMALEGIGREAGAAIPGLIWALSDQRPEVRQKAAMALGAIANGEEEVVQALVHAAGETGEPLVRRAVAEALLKFTHR